MAKSFGNRPYSRRKFSEISNLTQRAFADSFPGTPSEIRLNALRFNPTPVCCYCGERSSNGEATDPNDHVYSVSSGGLTVPGNLVHACNSCNTEKGSLHPLVYWRRRKTAGWSVWIDDEKQFAAWLHETTAAFRNAYPEFYAIASKEELDDHDRAFLMGKWRDYFQKSQENLQFEDVDFWFPERQTARADSLRHWIPSVFPEARKDAKTSQRELLYILGLLVELFGDEDAENILNGEYSGLDFYELITRKSSDLIREHGKKNRKAQRLIRLRNAVMKHSYPELNLESSTDSAANDSREKVKKAILEYGERMSALALTELSAHEQRLTSESTALQKCRTINRHLADDSTRLVARMRFTEAMLKHASDKGRELAVEFYSQKFRKADDTTKGDLRSAAAAAGLHLNPYNVKPLF